MSAAERVDRFLFAPVELRTAATFRVLLAPMLALVFWPASHRLIGALERTPGALALWDGIFFTPAWWVATLLALLGFAAGIGDRRSGWVAAAFLLPLVPVRTAVSRQVLWMALLAFSMLPSDPRRAFGRTSTAGEVAGPIWPIRLVQLQLSVLYGVNALGKLSPEYLRGDVLVGLARTLPNFHVDLASGFLELGPVAVPAWLCAVGTVAIEAALAVGFWIPRLRIATAVLGVAFHLSLQWVLTIGWLDWTCLFLYLAFLLPFEPHGPGAPRRAG